MKLSDYVARFLAAQGIGHVFAITGGASLHLIDSISRRNDVDFICPQHEQAGAMAADAYARVTGRLGAAIATSGPGFTNMITGICSAYYDSVPVLYITGQVSTFRAKGALGVRQLGFQETDTVQMCQQITKYAVSIDEASRIRYELEKAVYLAFAGRPGPVLVDIPDNLQREDIDPEKLEAFVAPEKAGQASAEKDHEEQIEQVRALLQGAERPVLVLGWGVRLAGAVERAVDLVEHLNIPVLPTWGMKDFLPADHPLLAGTFGTHGTRTGNFVVQNADVILSIGSRLDTHETGTPLDSFARQAELMMVDIDPTELAKFATLGRPLSLSIERDAGDFMADFMAGPTDFSGADITPWRDRIQGWQQQFPECPQEFYNQQAINPYVFNKILAEESADGDTFVLDTGCALAWMMQSFDFKPKQRAIHAFNNTPMGFALPGAIGASLALGRGPVTCIAGDGSLQMNLQELATVIRHDLPIKIFLINNHGYSMIKQTQEQWLDARYNASSVEGGLALPDFTALAKVYGFKTLTIKRNTDIRARVRETLDHSGPTFCNVEIESDHRVLPQVKYGRPLEDSEPLLDRHTFNAAMIIPPMAASSTLDD